MINEDALWVVIGVFIGMISTGIVNSDYTLIGAILGGLIGYMIGRNI